MRNVNDDYEMCLPLQNECGAVCLSICQAGDRQIDGHISEMGLGDIKQ